MSYRSLEPAALCSHRPNIRAPQTRDLPNIVDATYPLLRISARDVLNRCTEAKPRATGVTHQCFRAHYCVPLGTSHDRLTGHPILSMHWGPTGRNRPCSLRLLKLHLKFVMFNWATTRCTERKLAKKYHKGPGWARPWAGLVCGFWAQTLSSLTRLS